MAANPHSNRVRIGAAGLAVAGVFFVLYPMLRPFSDEASLAGAAAFASPNWLLSHMLAMVAFILLAFGLHAIFLAADGTSAERLAYMAFAFAFFGVGLVLPFYGGEAYGLHAIGQEALRQGDDSLLGLAQIVRSGAGLYLGLTGFLLLAAGVLSSAVLVWRSGTYSRWSGIPLAVGTALYIPQFFGTQPLRVAHGVLMAIGCAWMAVALWKQSGPE